jgi:hypothetical protein
MNPSHTPAPPAITRIGTLALTRSPVHCWNAHARRWNNATRSAKTPRAVSGPRPTKANRPSGCDFCIVVVATSVAAEWVEMTTEFVASTGGPSFSTIAACTWSGRRTRRGRCRRGRSSRCRRGVDAPDGACHRSRQRQVSEIIEGACADPENQARRRALDDPFHRHPNSAPTQSIRRDQPPYSMREWIADKALNVTDQCGAERDFGTHELLVICHCRRKHRVHPTRVCLLLATLPDRLSPNISHAALASSQPTPA